jgi:hypothetical protein
MLALLLLPFLAIARPPVVLFPEFQLSVSSTDVGYRFLVDVPPGFTIYGSFTDDPFTDPDECSTAHSAWTHGPTQLSADLSADAVSACLDETGGAFYAWVSKGEGVIAMKSLPLAWSGESLLVGQDARASIEVSELSWSPGGVMLLELGYSSEFYAITNASLESARNLELLALTITANNSQQNYEQRLHFLSESGAMRENDLVWLTLENGQELLFTVQLALEDGELMPDRHGVEMLTFKDAELTQPYIASVLGGESLAEGQRVCVVLQDTTGSQVSAGSARLCSSYSSDLSLETACSSSSAEDLVSLEIFNRAADYVNDRLDPELRDSASRSQAVFCFSPIKLSERVHILEVDLASHLGLLQRRSFEWHGNHSDGMWFHCAYGYHWDAYFYQCRPSGFWNSTILWGAVALVFVVFVCGAMLYYTEGHLWPDHEWETGHNAPPTPVATGAVSVANIMAGITEYRLPQRKHCD